MTPSVQDLMDAWVKFEEDFKASPGFSWSYPIPLTSDPRLRAGQYLQWSKGNLDQAIHYVAANCSGQYLDQIPFAGNHETLVLLRSMKEADSP